MCDSDSELEHVSTEKSTKDSFENVPKETEYQFKLLNWLGDKLARFGYQLKKGKELPYSVPLKGRV